MKEYTVDCLGEACPVPLMKVQKQMEKMEVDDGEWEIVIEKTK